MQSHAVLQTEVAVIHRGSVLAAVELVRHALSRGYGALGYARAPVILIVVELAYAMEMNSRAIGCDVVGHMDYNVVAPVRYDCWAGHCPIGYHAFTSVPVWRAVNLLDSEPVLDGAARMESGVIVVGIDVVFAPAFAGRIGVLTSRGQVAGITDCKGCGSAGWAGGTAGRKGRGSRYYEGQQGEERVCHVYGSRVTVAS